MASILLRDIGSAVRRTGSAQVSRIPRGPRTRSQANLAPDPEVEESPSVTVAERNNQEEKLQRLCDEICQETGKKFDDELGIFLRQNYLLKSKFHTALEELTARVVLLENSLADVTKVQDPEVLDLLKLATKEKDEMRTKPWNPWPRQGKASMSSLTEPRDDSRSLSELQPSPEQEWIQERSPMASPSVLRRRTN